MSESESFSFVRRVSQLGTWLQTFLYGKQVGCDAFGNRYFCERCKSRPSNGGRVRQKRWVLYAGEPEPTKIPPEWHAWLHYTTDAPLDDKDRKSWQKPHQSNRTGTSEAWLPPSLKGDASVSCGYEPWTPDQST